MVEIQFKRIWILFSIIVTSYIIHQNDLSKEDQLFTPTGKRVEVNGHKMHVYLERDGDYTLVFMSGIEALYWAQVYRNEVKQL